MSDGQAIFHAGVQARGGEPGARTGMAISQTAKDLGLNDNVLRRWVSEAKQPGSHSFPGRGKQRPDDAECSRLKRELAKAQAERDILKTAIAFFAKEPR